MDQRLSALLGTVIIHKSVDALRRGERRRAESLENLLAEPMDSEAEDPAEQMEAKERDENLAVVLDELRREDPLNCWLVCEHILEGRSLKELAAETGLGVNAISCRIGRNLKKLGSQLLEYRPVDNTDERSVPMGCGRKS